MKKCIKKLLFSAIVVFMGININFNANARVTREVAEATLPYLMEAAGIPGDEEAQGITVKAEKFWYKKNKIQAILSMIYTDEGQQQMVNWAVSNAKPDKLAVLGEPFSDTEHWNDTSSNIICNPGAEISQQERIFQLLFPCNTGTFTSFAAHNSRLGYYALKYELVELVGATILNIGKKAELMTNQKTQKEKTVLENILTNLNKSTLDTLLVKIIFLLDICDDLDQLKAIYNMVTSSVINVEASDIPTKYNEYECRPVPATMAQKKNNEGECIENLYRHIIAIATQIGSAEYSNVQLPLLVHLNGKNHSGITEIQSHKLWAENLTKTYLMSKTVNSRIQEHMIDFIKQATLPCFKLKLDEKLKSVTENECKKIHEGTFENITDVIESIAFYDENCSNRSVKTLCQRLAEALYKISNEQNKFEISILDKNNYPICTPSNTNCIIELKENSINQTLNRTVLLAICNNGHAEIISIRKN